MKETAIDRQRTLVAHSQPPEFAQPGKRALADPAPLVTPQGSTVLHRRFAPPFTMRDDRFDAQSTKLSAQSIAIVAAIHNHALRFLSRASRTMSPPHADRRERFLDELDLRRSGLKCGRGRSGDSTRPSASLTQPTRTQAPTAQCLPPFPTHAP